jgi:hypothetical protein
MQITFRRYDNTVSSLEPVEQAILFDFGSNAELAESQFQAIKEMLERQEEARLVNIFSADDTAIHFMRTFLPMEDGCMPNEDCYINCL